MYSAADIHPIPEPWRGIPLDQRDAVARELAAALAPGHPFHGVPLIPILDCPGCGDVIISVETYSMRWVRVHRNRPPEQPHRPTFEQIAGPLYRSLAGHEH
jgi:hypothetical protein